MEVSAAIITYNRPEAVKRCLDSLQKQTKNLLEIILIDSSEEKKTRQIAKGRKGVRYRHTGRRLFQPACRNIALRMCRGDIIAFLDDDTVASPTWAEGIAEGYEDKTAAGVAGPAINSDERLNPAMRLLKTENNLSYFTFSGDIVSEARRWIPPKPVYCTIMLGANMSFLKRLLVKVGGFDESYGRHAAFREETDPQIALVKRGYRFVYNPKALVWHVMHKTGGIRSNPPADYYYWCGVNHRYLVDKHGFSKFFSRLSWLTFSRSPPSLPLGIILALARRDTSILGWYKGLFAKRR